MHAHASIARGPGIAHVAASGALDVVAVARGTAGSSSSTRGGTRSCSSSTTRRRRGVLLLPRRRAAGAGDARPPVLVAAGGDQLRVWDLETRALLHVEKRVGGVAALHAGGPAGGPTGADAVVVTSAGADATTAGVGRVGRREVRGSAGGATGSAARPRWCAGTARPRAAARSRARPATAYGSLQLLVAAPRDRSPRCLHAVRDRLNGELSQRGAADARAKRPARGPEGAPPAARHVRRGGRRQGRELPQRRHVPPRRARVFARVVAGGAAPRHHRLRHAAALGRARARRPGARWPGGTRRRRAT